MRDSNQGCGCLSIIFIAIGLLIAAPILGCAVRIFRSIAGI